MPPVDYNAPKSKSERVANLLSVALLIFLFMFTALRFLGLPDTVPTHVNMSGDIDGWGSRWFVWFLPFISIFTFGILVIPGKLPDMINYPVKITPDNAQRQFLLVRLFLHVMNLAIVFIFVVLQLVLLSLAHNSEIPINPGALIVILLTIIFLPIVIYLSFAVRAR